MGKTLSPGVGPDVIHLAYFGGFPHREIAARLNLPEGTIKGRIRLGP
ncbi:MAG: hypothetical protein H0U55_00465 [Rubrobacteraceae bacterium]|nr:hypothetical protein [Rubrobacteraceae bacterium]